jgi:ActR/RegA family two-component response regulator
MSAGKILIVDDDPQIHRVLKVILTAERYEVDEARSGEAALSKFRGVPARSRAPRLEHSRNGRPGNVPRSSRWL